jgi:hypothetical protein
MSTQRLSSSSKPSGEKVVDELMTAASMAAKIKSERQALEVRKESRQQMMEMIDELKKNGNYAQVLTILDGTVIPQFRSIKEHVDSMREDGAMTSEEMFAYYHTIAPKEVDDMLAMMLKFREDVYVKLQNKV